MSTSSGKTCQLPFTYLGSTYKACTVNGPNNPSFLPQCLTTSGSWDFCNGKYLNDPFLKIIFFKFMFTKVPNTAVFSYVTTQKSSSNSVNQGSLQGGTLLWIRGLSKCLIEFICTLNNL